MRFEMKSRKILNTEKIKAHSFKYNHKFTSDCANLCYLIEQWELIINQQSELNYIKSNNAAKSQKNQRATDEIE